MEKREYDEDAEYAKRFGKKLIFVFLLIFAVWVAAVAAVAAVVVVFSLT